MATRSKKTRNRVDPVILETVVISPDEFGLFGDLLREYTVRLNRQTSNGYYFVKCFTKTLLKMYFGPANYEAGESLFNAVVHTLTRIRIEGTDLSLLEAHKKQKSMEADTSIERKRSKVSKTLFAKKDNQEWVLDSPPNELKGDKFTIKLLEFLDDTGNPCWNERKLLKTVSTLTFKEKYEAFAARCGRYGQGCRVICHWISARDVALLFIKALDSTFNFYSIKGTQVGGLIAKMGNVSANLGLLLEESSRYENLVYTGDVKYWGTMKLPTELKFLGIKGRNLSKMEGYSGAVQLSVASIMRAISRANGEFNRKKKNNASKEAIEKALISKMKKLKAALKNRCISSHQKMAVEYICDLSKEKVDTKLVTTLVSSFAIVKPRMNVRYVAPICYWEPMAEDKSWILNIMAYNQNVLNVYARDPDLAFIQMVEGYYEDLGLLSDLYGRTLESRQQLGIINWLNMHQSGEVIHPRFGLKILKLPPPMKGSPTGYAFASDKTVMAPSLRLERVKTDTITADGYVSMAKSMSVQQVLDGLGEMHRYVSSVEVAGNSLVHKMDSPHGSLTEQYNIRSTTGRHFFSNDSNQ